MTLFQSRTWLLAYDIADIKRLARVHRYIKKYAIPLQYSVFALQCHHRQIAAHMADLQTMINPSFDDVRAYCLPERGEIYCYGKRCFPQEITMILPKMTALFES